MVDPQAGPLVDVRGVTFGYGREVVLDHVSLAIEPRDFLAVIGPNGASPIVVVTHDVTSLAPMVKRIACINRKLFYHGGPELSLEAMEEVYGCPVELATHGVPHRVLHDHRH